MKIKIYYDEYQMHDAVEFIAKKNTFFIGQHERIREAIMDAMIDMAKDSKITQTATMGFLITVDHEEKEGFNYDESSITFNIYVDPSLGCMDYDEHCKEIDV